MNGRERRHDPYASLTPRQAAGIFLFVIPVGVVLQSWRLQASDDDATIAVLDLLRTAWTPTLVICMTAWGLQYGWPRSAGRLAIRHAALAIIGSAILRTWSLDLGYIFNEAWFWPTATYQQGATAALTTFAAAKFIEALRRSRLLNVRLAARIDARQSLDEISTRAVARASTSVVDSVETTVLRHLRAIRSMKGTRQPSTVADALETVVTRVIRPIGHAFHPLGLRNGVIAAIESLDPDIVVSVNGDDGAEAARLPAWLRFDGFRLIRHLALLTSITSITVDEGSLTVRGDFRAVPDSAFAASSLVAEVDRSRSTLVVRPARMGTPQLRLPRGRDVTLSKVVHAMTAGPLVQPSLSAALGVVILPMAPLSSPLGVSTALRDSAVSVSVALAMVSVLARTLPDSVKPRVVNALAVALMHAAVGVVAGVVYHLMHDDGSNRAAAIDILAGVLTWGSVGLGSVMHSAAAKQVARETALLRDAEAAARRRRSDVDATTTVVEEHIATFLHRTLQGRLAAIVVLLRTERQDEAYAALDSLIDQDIPEALVRIRSGLDWFVEARPTHLQLGPPEAPLPITEDVPGGLLAVLPRRVVAGLSEVVAEAATNALRHGGASHLHVSLAAEGHEVVLRCYDNGRGVSGDWQPGLGSGIFDRTLSGLRGRWLLANSGSGTVLTVRVPLSRGRATDQEYTDVASVATQSRLR